MKKSIFLFFAAILCAMSVSAKMVYLKPSDNWKESGAIFYVWYWTGSGSGTAGKLNYVGLGGLYGYDIGDHTSFKFTRNKSTSNSPWTDNWGETGDLSYNANKPCYNVVNWNANGSGLIAAPSAYIAGAKELMGGHEWSADASDNKMTLSDGKWTLIKTIESIAKGDYEYKVTDGSWGWSLGKDGKNAKINIPATGKYEVTFTYNPSNETVSATATQIYSVTVNAGEGGTASGTSECVSGNSVNISAEALENYEFVNWTIASGSGSFGNTSEASTTFQPTSNATIQANFRSTVTYSLTLQGGTGIESVTGDNNNVTLGDSYAITATLTDGYKFVGWTADVAANAEIANASAASTSVVVKNGSVVLTASAKEYLSTLTTANAYSEGDAGLAIPTATVSEIGVVTTADVEATPACVGYVFANWTLTNCERIDGGAANATSITVKSKGDGAEASVVANYTKVPTATVYFVNNKSWSTIKVYAWGGSVGENASWSGLDITANKETEKLGEFDVYSYTVNQGAHANLIFNDGSGDDSKKTSDYVWTDGKYYYMGANKDYAGSTKEEITTLLLPDPLATDVYLAGEMTNWGTDKVEFKKETAEGTIASVTVNLTAKSYTFQLIIDGTWYGNKSTMKRGGDAVHEGGWSFKDTSYGANCTIVADFPGDYTFTWNLETEKLTVTYPELPTYTVTATAENGTVTGAGEYKHGTEATLVATPNAGYAFVNWKKGEEVVSSEASYTFTVTANTDLVAVFAPEETHEVTVSYICNSNPIPGHDAHTLAVGITTPSTITAPAITNYTFNGWTLGPGVQAVDANANPIQITTKAEGEYTLTANYTKIELTYTVTVPEGTEKCYIAGDMNSWSFQEMTPTANANEFTITIDGATTDHKYKYTCGEGWAYVEKKEDGSELDANRTYNANDVVKKWAEPAKCYLMGIGGDWTTGIEMEEDGDQFKLLRQPIAEGEQFKFKYGDTWSTEVENYEANGVNWVETSPGSGQYNITLPAGNYDFYYKKETNKVYIGKVEAPAVKSGKFSTGKYEYAEFAPGNLQYHTSNGTWHFAQNQYDYVGEANINVGNPNYKGWIDMFGWSTSETNYGVDPRNENEYYDGAFVDWSNLFPGEGWSTLSADQWKYLLNERDNADNLKQIAKVGDVLGIMLFPDVWTLPTGCEPVNTLNHDPEDGENTKYDFYSQNYTLAQWTELEKEGAVFLPAAGRRTGGWGNETISPHMQGILGLDSDGHYKYQDNTNYHAYYWTSTYRESDKTATYLHNIKFLGNNDGTVGQASLANEQGRYGQSVRLAKVTSTLIEIGDGDNSTVITENAEKTVNVQVKRTFEANNGYYTICLPFDLAAEKIGKALQINSVTENVAEQGMNVVFTEVTNLVAGQPYLLLPSKNLENPIFEGVTIVNTTGETTDPVVGAGIKITFTGIINGVEEHTNGSTDYYVGDYGFLYNGTTKKLGLRAFFTITDEAGNPAKVRARVVVGENPTTGFENITTTDKAVKIIENGQLIIIRDGVKYNAQGVKF